MLTFDNKIILNPAGMNFLQHLGNYTTLIKASFARPEKGNVYWKLIAEEVEKMGLGSVGIVVFVAFFFGAVIAIQTANNMDNPLLPEMLIGLGTRDSVILEFSSTIMCLILAGKVGSNIASEIGSMKVTQQIDALETMGVNSAGYVIFPKIVAAVFIFPFLSLCYMFVGIFGGWVGVVVTGVINSSQFIYGLHYGFKSYYIVYTLTKTVVFAFIISSVSSYYGYNTELGSKAVGDASTKAVVNSSLIILIFNLLLTKLML